jgi:hypothetical protein
MTHLGFSGIIWLDQGSTESRPTRRRNQAPLVLLPNWRVRSWAVAGGFVERVLGLKQGGVCGGHELPVEQISHGLFTGTKT